MIKLKNILLEQFDNVPTPAPGTYNLRFTVNYRDGNREPVSEKDIQVSDQDVQEFEINRFIIYLMKIFGKIYLVNYQILLQN